MHAYTNIFTHSHIRTYNCRDRSVGVRYEVLQHSLLAVALHIVVPELCGVAASAHRGRPRHRPVGTALGRALCTSRSGPDRSRRWSRCPNNSDRSVGVRYEVLQHSLLAVALHIVVPELCGVAASAQRGRPRHRPVGTALGRALCSVRSGPNCRCMSLAFAIYEIFVCVRVCARARARVCVCV